MREAEKESRDGAEPGPGRLPASPVILCLHTQKFRTISQLPFQSPLKRDRFLPGYSPSIQSEWLLSWENPNLWHPQWVTSLRCAIASVQTAVPRNACEIPVCVRGSGHIAWIKSNRTPSFRGFNLHRRLCLHSRGSFSHVPSERLSLFALSWGMYTALFAACGLTLSDAAATKASSL